MRRLILFLLAIGASGQTYTATGPFSLKVISPAIYNDTYLSPREGYEGNVTFTLLSAAPDKNYYFNTTDNSTTGLGALYYPITYPDDNDSGSYLVEYSAGFELDPDSNVFPFEISTPLSLDLSTSFGFSPSGELQLEGGVGTWVGCPQVQNQWILVQWYNGNGTLNDNSCIQLTIVKRL